MQDNSGTCTSNCRASRIVHSNDATQYCYTRGMKTALITGSETFGKYITNPTKWLALSVDKKIIADFQIYSLVLPSVVGNLEGTQDTGTKIVDLAQEIDADVIISFGMRSDVRGFRIERSATNWVSENVYCSPEENNQPLDPKQPAKEQLQNDLSAWDLNKMQTLFYEANIPFDPRISDDPGQYSCNGWIYRTLLAKQKKLITTPYLFIHTACTEEAIEFIPDFDRAKKMIIKKEDTIKALELILQSLTP